LKYGENGILVSLDEPQHKIFQEAGILGWDLEKLCREQKLAFGSTNELSKGRFKASSGT
jgi:KaiC/GvpD/RAD55 family RecA-like ATPase